MSSRYTADGRRRSSMAHARHGFYCSCGKVVHGNGAKAMHRAMHDRKADGHRYIGRNRWLAETESGQAWTSEYERQRVEIQAKTDLLKKNQEN